MYAWESACFRCLVSVLILSSDHTVLVWSESAVFPTDKRSEPYKMAWCANGPFIPGYLHLGILYVLLFFAIVFLIGTVVDRHFLRTRPCLICLARRPRVPRHQEDVPTVTYTVRRESIESVRSLSVSGSMPSASAPPPTFEEAMEC